jgi:hypothetical protein
VPHLIQGRVIYPTIPIPDPQGRNPKSGRPFVVMTETSEINVDDYIQAVGISGELDAAPASETVFLSADIKNRLQKDSVAVCTWRIEIHPSKFDFDYGFIRKDKLLEIIEKVAAANRAAFRVEEPK